MGNPRADFVPIVDRPILTLPDSKRVAAMLVVNVEQKEFDQPVRSPRSRSSRSSNTACAWASGACWRSRSGWESRRR